MGFSLCNVGREKTRYRIHSYDARATHIAIRIKCTVRFPHELSLACCLGFSGTQDKTDRCHLVRRIDTVAAIR